MIKYGNNFNISNVTTKRKKILTKRKPVIGVRCNTTGSDIIYKKMIEKKVKDVFLISGGSIMHVVDKLYSQNQMEYIVSTNEQSMMYMAKGYGSYEKLTAPAVCLVTSGPGITNCVTGLLDAKRDGIPLVLISGQVSTAKKDTGAFQECEAAEITRKVTKWSYYVNSVNELPYVLEKAFHITMNGIKGPVHLDVPLDVLTDVYDAKLISNYVCGKDMNKKNNQKDMSDELIQFIVEKINNASRPVVIAGNGCKHAGKYVNDFIKLSNIPITTTLHGMGIYDENERLALKMMGMHGSVYSNKAIQNSDCIIALGCRLDDRVTCNISKFAPKCKHFIHCNIDDKEFDKIVDAKERCVNVKCDVSVFLGKMQPHILFKHRHKWIKNIMYWKRKYPFKYVKDEIKIKTQDVMIGFNDYMKRHHDLWNNIYITTGVGNHQMMAAQYIDWRNQNSIVTSGGAGVMGVGLPYAIGIYVAAIKHNRNVIVVDLDGDSSFNMTSGELKTIVQYNIPVKIFIFNDKKQSMVNTWERRFFNDRVVGTMNWKNPEYVHYDLVYPDLKTIKCYKKTDLMKSIERMMTYNGPILGEFIVESDECLPLVPSTNAIDDPLY